MEQEGQQKKIKTDDSAAAAVAEQKTKGSAFFASLKLAPSEHLDSKEKTKCPKCNRNMKYYCYSCVEKVDAERTPVVRLPINLEM